jgi:hypothetical protein
MMTFDPTPFVKIPTEPLDNCRSQKLGQNNTHRDTEALFYRRDVSYRKLIGYDGLLVIKEQLGFVYK